MIFITVCSKVISTSLCSCLFLISSYGPPLVQRASYLPQHSSLFGLVAQLIMIIFSLTALTVCLLAQDVFPMVHIVQPIWLMLQNVSKTLVHVQYIHIQFHFHMSLYKINTFMIRKITLESNSSCINLSLPLIIMIMVLLASINGTIHYQPVTFLFLWKLIQSMSEFHPRFFVREGIEWMMRIALLLGGVGVSFPRPSLPAV